MKTELLQKLAELAHLGLISAGLLMPQATGLWKQVKKLSPFAARYFDLLRFRRASVRVAG
jgi:hypothetical protein